MKMKHSHAGLIVFSVVLLLSPLRIGAQDADLTNYERDTLITYAKEIMKANRYCALITLDESGYPQVRTMDPFLPEDDMVVWLGTNINSRKVHEIRNDSRVSLYYEAPDGGGYAVIQGNAYMIDDPEKKEKYWKEEWKAFYPDKHSTFTLIKVIPKKLEIIYYKGGISGSSTTWEVPYVEFYQ
ncbi:MAG: pyridoxamine 5'-phosphate oxidase family protein [Bacteroidales bacterium]